MAIRLADTLLPMADFPAAYAEHLFFNDEESIQKKYDEGKLGGITFKDYAIDTEFKSGNLIAYNHIVYKALKDFTATNFDTDLTDGNIEKYIGLEDNSIPDWKEETDYFVGDIRMYDNKKYQAIKDHTSSQMFNDEAESWIQLIDSYSVVSETQYEYMKNNNLLDDRLYIKKEVTDEVITLSQEEYQAIWNDMVINPTE